MSTAIISYGAGNIGSVSFALNELGEEFLIADTPDKIHQADRIILPGVGAFAPVWKKLVEMGLAEAIDSTVKAGKPYLGICLGMQLMCSGSLEGGQMTKGFSWVNSVVQPLSAQPPQWRVPHMGWATVNWQDDGILSAKVKKGSSYYFCHSYHVKTEENAAIATADFNGPIVAALQAGSAIGIQFHPERSGSSGIALIEAFLNWIP